MTTLTEKIKALYEAERALRETTKTAEQVDVCNQWLFCVHTHYEQPRVSVWTKDSNPVTKKPTSFILNDDGWQLLDIGDYVDKKSEIEAAFKAWLALSC